MSVEPIRPGFTGVFTALVTPMRVGKSSLDVEREAHPALPDEGGREGPPQIDAAGLAALVEAQLAGGIQGLVACGTTGEAATMTAAEQARVIAIVVEAAAGKVPVLAGIGSPSTAQSLELGRAAIACGVQGLLAVTPYYNRPPQEGLVQHFTTLASLRFPLMLYNVPPRTGCDLLPDTVARLCQLPEVVSLKEASGSVQRTEQLVRRLGDRLSLLSGEDAINLPLYCVGARGAVSVVSNVAPALTVEIYEKARAGALFAATQLHHKFVPLAEALFSEPNPIPTKAALHQLMPERVADVLRLPLVPMTEAGRTRLHALLVEMGFCR
jgi:4-hydroxy-tetrahydrodipicolinate synthase